MSEGCRSRFATVPRNNAAAKSRRRRLVFLVFVLCPLLNPGTGAADQSGATCGAAGYRTPVDPACEVALSTAEGCTIIVPKVLVDHVVEPGWRGICAGGERLALGPGTYTRKSERSAHLRQRSYVSTAWMFYGRFAGEDYLSTPELQTAKQAAMPEYLAARSEIERAALAERKAHVARDIITNTSVRQLDLAQAAQESRPVKTPNIDQLVRMALGN